MAHHQEDSSKIQALWYNVCPRILYMVSHQGLVDTQQEEETGWIVSSGTSLLLSL